LTTLSLRAFLMLGGFPDCEPTSPFLSLSPMCRGGAPFTLGFLRSFDDFVCNSLIFCPPISPPVSWSNGPFLDLLPLSDPSFLIGEHRIPESGEPFFQPFDERSHPSIERMNFPHPKLREGFCSGSLFRRRGAPLKAIHSGPTPLFLPSDISIPNRRGCFGCSTPSPFSRSGPPCFFQLFCTVLVPNHYPLAAIGWLMHFPIPWRLCGVFPRAQLPLD